MQCQFRQAELKKRGILISMSGKGNCYDNSMVEAFFKTLKAELVWRTVFQTRAEAHDALARYIDGFYNLIRRTRRWTTSAPPSSNGALPTQPLSTKAEQVQRPQSPAWPRRRHEVARRA